MSRSFVHRMPIPLEELLQHAGWLRALAASLVRDPGRAEDLVQDTWVAALRHPPLAGASPRPWLERVFRNLARNRRRDERTRAEHEPRALERRPSPGPDAIAEVLEAQRVLAEAVGRLGDPARSIVVLRYFRGLDSGAIGRELGLPPGTVRWKLAEALQELRRELDRRYAGGRRAWSLALGRVLASAAAPAAPVSLGWVGATMAALALVAAGWWSARRATTPEPPLAPVGARTASAESARSPGLLAALSPEDSRAAAVPEPVRSPLAAVDAPPGRPEDLPDIRGSVLVDGAPPARSIDLALSLLDVDRRLSTDEAGRFEVFALGDGVPFGLTAPGFLVEDDEASWNIKGFETPELDLVLRLLTPPAIRGRVVDARGAPVPGAHGVYELRTDASGWSLSSGRGEIECDAEGRFVLPLLDLMADGMPKMRADDTWQGTLLFDVARIGHGLFDLLPVTARDLELGDLVLEPVRVLAFQVRDERGAPLSGAVARLDDHWIAAPSSPTNGDGRGELRHAPDRRARVRFSALGYADRVLDIEPGEHPVAWLEPAVLLEVQLEPPANTYEPFPEVVLTAQDVLFEEVDAPKPDIAFDRDPIQTELGASPSNGHGTVRAQGGVRSNAHWNPDSGGRVVIVGLRAGVAITVEARDMQGRALARRELVLGRGEHRRIALSYGE